jgi:DNA mismatch repair protein MutL
MDDSPAIRVMPEDLALKIAAGEVVERPSSAVKELIDNAVDAGARSVRIEVRDAGLKMIRVSDDGRGIRQEDVPLAFTSHATSKIASLDDLERLETLGFRGEALPSIAAVARVEMQTRAARDAIGTRYSVQFGVPQGQGMCSVPAGTRVTVADLFANVPARRKFVRSLRAEGGQIQNVVMQYALVRPAVRFTLNMDGRTTFESPGTGKLEDAVAAVYGPEVAGSMIAVDEGENGITVTGLTSRPSLSRSTRAAIHVFVNGRPVQNRSLGFALEEAYAGFLMTGRHPVSVIHLTVSSSEVDANIHPSKNEVRFAREREVHGALHRAVVNALLGMRLEQRKIGGFDEPITADAGAVTPVPLMEVEDGSRERPLLPDVPALRVFGQANRTFIIAEGPSGVYMIDQHAAHERVLFDRLEEQLNRGDVPVQPLLDPLSVELTPAQMAALETNRDLLARAGLNVDPFGESACLIRCVPAIALRAPVGELVIEVLGDLQSLPSTAAAAERALATMACKAAVKAGQALEIEEMRELVMQLERTPRPSTCPHGRPTMIHLSHSQLEREFGRR